MPCSLQVSQPPRRRSSSAPGSGCGPISGRGSTRLSKKNVISIVKNITPCFVLLCTCYRHLFSVVRAIAIRADSLISWAGSAPRRSDPAWPPCKRTARRAAPCPRWSCCGGSCHQCATWSVFFLSSFLLISPSTVLSSVECESSQWALRILLGARRRVNRFLAAWPAEVIVVGALVARPTPLV